jgi:fibronectin-binding autotransporter adhesin
VIEKLILKRSCRAARSSAIVVAVLVVVAVLLLSAPLRAASYTWAVNSGNWSIASNWGGNLPTSNDSALVTSSGTATVSLSESCGSLAVDSGSGAATLQMIGGGLATTNINLGVNAAGAFTQSAGAASCTNLALGVNPNSNGTYNLTGGSLYTAWGELIGTAFNIAGNSPTEGGSGVFNQSGGTNTAASITNYTGYEALYVGYYNGATGTYNLSGSGLLSAGTEFVGYYGTGTFNQTGGTNSMTGQLNMDDGYAPGLYNLKGPGLVSAGSEYIGDNGGFTQTAGTNAIAGNFTLANYQNPNGYYILSGSGLMSAVNEYIGNGYYDYSQTFTHTGGTNSVSGAIYIGYSGTHAIYNLSGSGVLSAANEYLGYVDTVGDIYSAAGTVNQSGGLNSVTGTIYFGSGVNGGGGPNVYNLTGGTLAIGQVDLGPGGVTFNFGGGVLQANGPLSTALAMTLTGSGGNAMINPAGYAVALSGALSGSGGLVLAGSGSLTLSANNSYSGGTIVSAGALIVSNTAGSATGSGNLTLQGGTLASGPTGSISGSVLAGNSANTITPGGSGMIGSLGVGGLTLDNLSTMVFDISSTASLDQINDSGALGFNGSGTAKLLVTAGSLHNGAYKLIGFASLSGLSTANLALGAIGGGSVPGSYTTQITASALDLVVNYSNPNYTLRAAPVNPTLIVGGSTALTLTINNTGGSGTPDSINFSGLGATAGGGGSIAGTGGSGTVAPSNSASYSGVSFTSSAAGSFNLTSTAAVSGYYGATPSLAATYAGSVTVLGHSLPSLTAGSGNGQTVIVGATGATALLTLSDGSLNQSGLAALDVDSLGVGVSGPIGGKLVASGSTQSYTASLSAASLGTRSETFSITVADDHTLPGASGATNASGSVTLTVLGHAAPALALQSGGGQTVITGATGITASLSLSNGTPGQSGLAALDIYSLGSGVSGPAGGMLLASGSTQAYTASLSTSALGSQSQVFSITAGDNPALPGAGTAAIVSAGVPVTIMDHSNASLSPTSNQTTQTISFGNLLVGASVSSQSFTLYNRAANTSAADTANLKLTGYTSAGDAAITPFVPTFNGLAAGGGIEGFVSMNTSGPTTSGTKTITIAASQLTDDSSLPGAGNNNNGALTVTIQGDVGNATADNSNSQTAFGPAMIASVAQSGSYAGLASTVMSTTGGGAGAVGTTATILGGTNSSGSAQTVSMAWRTHAQADSSDVISDIVNVSGMALSGNSGQTAPFVLQMDYDSVVLPGTSAASDPLLLAWLDPATGEWVNAIDGNFGMNEGTYHLGAWPEGALTLGDWGVNTANDTVWAVVNHNSNFAVVPEPSTQVLLGFGAIALLGCARRRRRSARAETATDCERKYDA